MHRIGEVEEIEREMPRDGVQLLMWLGFYRVVVGTREDSPSLGKPLRCLTQAITSLS